MLIFFWSVQGLFVWNGPIRNRTIFVEAEYRIIRIS